MAAGRRKLSAFMAAGASDEDGAGSASEEEAPPMLAVERRTARLERKQAAVRKEARDEELEAAVQEYEPFVLPSAEALEAEQHAPDLPAVRRRIQDVARVLANFKQLRQPGSTRGDYMERLMADLEHYYGCEPPPGPRRRLCRLTRWARSYNAFFLEYILNTFSVAEALELLEANEVQRPVTLRTNTLKARHGAGGTRTPPPHARAVLACTGASPRARRGAHQPRCEPGPAGQVVQSGPAGL